MITLPASINASLVLDIVLLVMLLVVAGAIVRTRSLLAAIILFGVYSMISAIWLVVMDAPDVAFTEAVVGAGISTIVLLGAILLTRYDDLVTGSPGANMFGNSRCSVRLSGCALRAYL